MNVAYDTERAKVRVIVVVEDSPVHYSSLLPILYKEIVTQTQAAMEESVNDEHRIFRMRARPKILVAETYEEALDLYRRYQPYLLGVLSDVRFPRAGAMDENAGYALLSMIREQNPDLPLLNLSSEEANREKAGRISAVFVNKNSPGLSTEIHNFFMHYLDSATSSSGFRMDGRSVGPATCGTWRRFCPPSRMPPWTITPGATIFPAGSWPGRRSCWHPNSSRCGSATFPTRRSLSATSSAAFTNGARASSAASSPKWPRAASTPMRISSRSAAARWAARRGPRICLPAAQGAP